MSNKQYIELSIWKHVYSDTEKSKFLTALVNIAETDIASLVALMGDISRKSS